MRNTGQWQKQILLAFQLPGLRSEACRSMPSNGDSDITVILCVRCQMLEPIWNRSLDYKHFELKEIQLLNSFLCWETVPSSKKSRLNCHESPSIECPRETEALQWVEGWTIKDTDVQRPTLLLTSPPRLSFPILSPSLLPPALSSCLFLGAHFLS